MCNLKFSVPKEIPVVFHNGSIYDYHFIIKELVEECEGQFTGLGKNTEKYITFFVPIEKMIKLIKMEKKSHKPYLTYDNLSIAHDLW